MGQKTETTPTFWAHQKVTKILQNVIRLDQARLEIAENVVICNITNPASKN